MFIKTLKAIGIAHLQMFLFFKNAFVEDRPQQFSCGSIAKTDPQKFPYWEFKIMKMKITEITKIRKIIKI